MKVIYPGHKYSLTNLKGHGETILQFSQQEPHELVDGPSCQEVLRAVIDRVQHLDTERHWKGNEEIVHHLRWSIALFEMRALERKVEKGLEIELLATDNDGHLSLRTQQGPEEK